MLPNRRTMDIVLYCTVTNDLMSSLQSRLFFPFTIPLRTLRSITLSQSPPPFHALLASQLSPPSYGPTTICHGSALSLKNVAVSSTGSVAFVILHLVLNGPACAIFFATIPAYSLNGQLAPGPLAHPTTGYTASLSAIRTYWDVPVADEETCEVGPPHASVAAQPDAATVALGFVQVRRSKPTVPRMVTKLLATYFWYVGKHMLGSGATSSYTPSSDTNWLNWPSFVNIAASGPGWKAAPALLVYVALGPSWRRDTMTERTESIRVPLAPEPGPLP